MADPIAVAVGTCRCPGSPHPDGDMVYLAPSLSIPMGVAAMAVIRDTPGNRADMEGALAEVFMHNGIRRWTFTDEKDELVPITPENIERLLPFANGGLTVANRCGELYAGDLFTPFGLRSSTQSQDGQTAESISASPSTSSRHPKPSPPSSPNGTDGKPSEVPAP